MQTLQAGGSEKSENKVFEDDGKPERKLKSNTPPKAETPLLDFDPRGKLVVVLQGNAVILESL